MNFDLARLRIMHDAPLIRAPVVYWMIRDQRAHDNWALLYAQQVARELQRPLLVVFVLEERAVHATRRHYVPCIAGLREVAATLADHHIAFAIMQQGAELHDFLKQYDVGLVVTDMSPLRHHRLLKEQVMRSTTCTWHEVDAHNIVPVWVASPKAEFGAYTIRPKITKQLPRFLTDLPRLQRHPYPAEQIQRSTDWDALLQDTSVSDRSMPVGWFQPGEAAARKAMRHFFAKKLQHYATDRNDPTLDGQSNLSPYFNKGHLAPQRAAYEVMHKHGTNAGAEAFFEEMVIRRELSDNFCWYTPHYDAFDGFPVWAQQTLNKHRHDEREQLYTSTQLERSETYDPLWNAAQQEMVVHGKMHGYMRMYWAKKLLEWTKSPEDALRIGLSLNDTYELDGNDPNGYVGVAWSIGGVHDRAWPERPVLGKIRYMNAAGCKRKFDVAAYIARPSFPRGRVRNWPAGHFRPKATPFSAKRK